ncbi:MAG: histidine kinase [Prevotellaceae bacterium]|jgi:sensor histidine kinase YesM|nr:histidine kinase [Prevotellaceae bacterium]
MKKNKRNKKTTVRLVCALLFGFGFSMLMSISDNLSPFDTGAVVFGITNSFSVLSIGYLFTRVLTGNSKKSMNQLRKSLIPSFILSFLATMFIALFLYYLGVCILCWVKGLGMENFINRIGSKAVISLSVGLFVCSIVFFYTMWRQAIEREQTLREENLKSQYQTLKTQVNPHFLFNSLNTLSEIIYTDVRKADSYIQKLSAIYRHVLDNEKTDLIPLDKEIEFAGQYFDLQKARYENKIQMDINFKNADKFRIVPVSLQILVENALKHNAISEEKPLKIHIDIEDGYLSVSNNIQRKSTLNNLSGTGLSNLGERVKLITGKEIIINRENNRFTVKLPLVGI